jgi:hypothetical protein
MRSESKENSIEPMPNKPDVLWDGIIVALLSPLLVPPSCDFNHNTNSAKPFYV